MEQGKRDITATIELNRLMWANRRGNMVETVIRLRSLIELSDGVSTEDLLKLVAEKNGLRGALLAPAESRSFDAEQVSRKPSSIGF